jgi:hypothetical protein
MGVHSRAAMWVQIVGWMLGFRLDGKLLRTSASRFLVRAGVPFPREVVVVGSRSLTDAIVNPARVGFSLMEAGQTGKGREERIISYLEVLLRDSPIQRSCFEAW